METSTLLHQLFERYQREGLAMSYTMEDFRRDYVKEHFKDLTPVEQLEAIQKVSPDEERETLQKMWLERYLKYFSPEEIERFLNKLKTKRLSLQRKPRRRKQPGCAGWISARLPPRRA